MNADISIIVPTYNTEKYITRCINSIFRQQIDNFEIVVVDDRSTDKTYDILRKLTERYEQIKLFRNKRNEGAGYTKNRALGLCTGKYICFVDSDDWLLDGALKQLFDLAEEMQCDDVYYDFVSVNESENNEIVNSSNTVQIRQIYEKGILFFRGMLDEKPVTVSAAHHFFRRSILNDKMVFSEHAMIDDWNFTAMLYNWTGKTVVLKNRYYVYFHRKQGSITNKSKEASLIGEIYNHAKEIYGNFNVRDEIYNITKQKCFLHMMIEIRNETYRRMQGWEKELEEVQQKINEDPEMQDLFDQSRFLSQYGRVDTDVLHQLIRKKNIYVYGAGCYGMDARRIIEANGLEVKSFVVSSKKDIIKIDIPVFSVEEVECSADSFWVLAVSDKYKKAVINTIIDKGIENYGCLIY